MKTGEIDAMTGSQEVIGSIPICSTLIIRELQNLAALFYYVPAYPAGRF